MSWLSFAAPTISQTTHQVEGNADDKKQMLSIEKSQFRFFSHLFLFSNTSHTLAEFFCWGNISSGLMELFKC